MCGLAGALIGSNRKRTREDLEAIGEMFTRLLAHSERRGPHATGVALVNIGGNYYVSKAPTPAGRFVRSRSYRTIIGRLDTDTALLMGHTRWPTRGSHLDNANNHPLVGRVRDGACILSHNGHISNADALFGAMGLRRKTQVDSEILLRIAERNMGHDGIDPDGLAADLAWCRGRMSLVVVATCDPTTVILVKGNQPLEFRYSETMDVLLYASESEFLDDALGDAGGWTEWPVSPMRIVSVSTRSLCEPIIKPFHFG